MLYESFEFSVIIDIDWFQSVLQNEEGFTSCESTWHGCVSSLAVGVCVLSFSAPTSKGSQELTCSLISYVYCSSIDAEGQTAYNPHLRWASYSSNFQKCRLPKAHSGFLYGEMKCFSQCYVFPFLEGSWEPASCLLWSPFCLELVHELC